MRGLWYVALSFSMLCLTRGGSQIYGSGDAGKTIFHAHAEARALTRQVAEKHNLSPHFVTASSTGELVSVNIAVDIESHLGHDGRIYIVDTARLFPPEPPLRGEKGSILCRLLRRELVHASSVPLSSDAFTAFGRHNSSELNEAVRAVWQRMVSTSIPGCVVALEDLCSRDFFSTMDPSRKAIATLLHHHGINIRFLMHVRSCTTSQWLKFAVLTEAIARTVKRQLFKELRLVHSTDREKHLAIATEHLNCLFSYTPTAVAYCERLESSIRECFVFLDDTAPLPSGKDIRAELYSAWTNPHDSATLRRCEQTLFSWVCFQCGLELTTDSLAAIKSSKIGLGRDQNLFIPTDIVDIKPKIKTISVKHILDKLRLEAEGKTSAAEQVAFYKNQLNEREAALGSRHPLVAFSLENVGDLMVSTGERAESVAAFTRALAIRRATFAEGVADEMTIVDTLEKMALAYHSFSMYEQAIDCVAEASEIVQRVLGASSARNVALVHEQASLRKGMGKYELSSALFKQTIDLATSLGEQSGANYLASALVEYARVQLHLGKADREIGEMQERALQLSEKLWGLDHSRVATVLNNLSIFHLWHRELASALPLCTRSLKIRLGALGRSHAYTGHSASSLGQLYMLSGDLNQAAVYLTESLEIYETSKRAEPIAMGKANYARLLMEQAVITSDPSQRSNLLDEARDLISASLMLATASADRTGQDQVATFLVDSAAIELFLGRSKEASSCLERAKGIRSICLRPDHPNLVVIDRLLDLLPSMQSALCIELSRRILVSQLTLYVATAPRSNN